MPSCGENRKAWSPYRLCVRSAALWPAEILVGRLEIDAIAVVAIAARPVAGRAVGRLEDPLIAAEQPAAVT